MTSHLTAIARSKPSRPCLWLEGILTDGDISILDYGCGKGGDVRYLNSIGRAAIGYDPHFFPEKPEGTFDMVMCNYVLNVVESPVERGVVISTCASMAPKGVFAVRTEKCVAENKVATPRGDGFVNGRGTFQRGFTEETLTELLTGSLPSTHAFHVFRSRNTIFGVWEACISSTLK